MARPWLLNGGGRRLNLFQSALRKLDNHWAVSAIGARKLRCAERLARERLTESAVGEQSAHSFDAGEDVALLLDRVALAYELAAIEGLDELRHLSVRNRELREQAIAASFRLFAIRRSQAVPGDARERLFFVLHLSATACCGDRWSDLRRWYEANATALEVPGITHATWDERLLYRLFDCWIRLFRKHGRDDLVRIQEIIAGLREEQKTFEARELANGAPAANQALALRLAALYHWARGTEILARHLSQGEPTTPSASLDKHFEAGVRAATASGDARHEIILRWFHAAVRIMVADSPWWTTGAANSNMDEAPPNP